MYMKNKGRRTQGEHSKGKDSPPSLIKCQANCKMLRLKGEYKLLEGNRERLVESMDILLSLEGEYILSTSLGGHDASPRDKVGILD